MSGLVVVGDEERRDSSRDDGKRRDPDNHRHEPGQTSTEGDGGDVAIADRSSSLLPTHQSASVNDSIRPSTPSGPHRDRAIGGWSSPTGAGCARARRSRRSPRTGPRLPPRRRPARRRAPRRRDRRPHGTRCLPGWTTRSARPTRHGHGSAPAHRRLAPGGPVRRTAPGSGRGRSSQGVGHRVLSFVVVEVSSRWRPSWRPRPLGDSAWRRFPWSEWSGCRDLNSGPLVPQTSALTKLRYSPCYVCVPMLPAQRSSPQNRHTR